ncbi:MAG: serine racemase VanT catalytic subunit [Mobilitalea sp.]
MNKIKSYTGIDYFRFAAALLVVAIHISPLSSYNETGDFILTRIIARVAVPFFFMTSGFFLISKYSCNAEKLGAFIKKTAFIYGIAIVIYIPLNIYSGYFTQENLISNVIKDIVFDGTMYHLWYLPASIVGAAMAWFLVKQFGFKRAFAIALILYFIGMFGDSYFGIAEKLPLLNSAYGYLFEVSDYTRNGIFYAPVFFVMGGIIAEKSISLGKAMAGLIVSFTLLLIEGAILHSFDLQRHDSMYITLIPCMYFLFTSLTHWRGYRISVFRTSALIIYIIHPMIIVLVRMFAKVLNLQKLLIEDNFVQYLVVCIISIAAAIFGSYILNNIKIWRKNVSGQETNIDRAWIEIDLDNLRHNVKTLRQAMPENCELMAVVKAKAYGHGTYEISTCINRLGVKAFAVATIDEGIELRRYGIQGEILILGYTNPLRAKELHKFDLSQTLIDYNYAEDLRQQGFRLKAHIKIDTGMHRLGFDFNDTSKIIEVFKGKGFDICGIYTHLCVSDSLLAEDVEFTHGQIDSYYAVLSVLKESGIALPKTHIQSSYGLLNYPELNCDYVRAGVALYGVLSSPKDKTRLELDLRPVLSLKSQIVLIRNIKEGESLGYGRAFIASRDSRIAILSIGYADGLSRKLSCGNGEVLIHGSRVSIVGRVCMDQIAVDVTGVPDAEVGDIVTLIGKDGNEELLAAEVADSSETITNEWMSRMGARLKFTH